MVAEDGPWDVIARLRRAAGSGALGQLLDCAYCLSLWLAIPFAALLGIGWSERVLAWLGLSGGVVLLERVVRGLEQPPRARYFEGLAEDDDDLLRK